MTLKEILDKVEFSDIAKPLIMIDSEVEDNLYMMKEYFDWLRMMKPQQSDEIKIDIKNEEMASSDVAAILLWEKVRCEISQQGRILCQEDRHKFSLTLAEQYQLNEETKSKLQESIMNGSRLRHYSMQSRTPNGDDGEYLANLIMEYFPEKKGSKSIVLIRGKENNLNENVECIWAAFGSFLKLPHPKYIVSPINGMTNIFVDILVFD